MLFRNTSAFFLAVCTSFSFLTCPIVGQPPPNPPLTPPPPPGHPCPGNKVALVMKGCPNDTTYRAKDRVVFRTEIEEVYGPHDCIDISSGTSPSESVLDDYDIIIVEGSSVYNSGSWIFDNTVKVWLSKTGNTALVNLAKAGKKVFFNAGEIQVSAGVAFPAGVFINSLVRCWETKLTPSPQLESALDDPDGINFHTFNPLRPLPDDAITLMKIEGECGSTRKPCSGTQLAELPSSGGLLLGTVQTAFKYVTPEPVKVDARSNLRKRIYSEYMCAPVTSGPESGLTSGPTSGPTRGPTSGPTSGSISGQTSGSTSTSPGPTPAPTNGPTKGPTEEPTRGPTSGPTGGPTVSELCGNASMIGTGGIVLECCDAANNAVGEACCGPNPYNPVLQVCCSDEVVVSAGTDCDCA